MSYRPDGTARFVGLARVTGRVDDRAGTFVLENTGDLDGIAARGRWSVVTGSATGSATGDLEGLSGTGGFEAGHAATYDLDYALG